MREAAVVDDQGRRLGCVTHDDGLDLAEEVAEKGRLHLAGTDSFKTTGRSVFHLARVRLTWLLPSMLGMLLSATALGISKHHFNPALFGALALFVPMVGATGGNSGIQISTIIIRGFATGELGASKLMRVFLREGRIALVMAPICGLVAWVAATICLAWLGESAPASLTVYAPHHVALAVGVAMMAAILVAALLGIALPFAFRRLGVDPAIAAGPLVTTLNDFAAVSIYMIIAMLIAR